VGIAQQDTKPVGEHLTGDLASGPTGADNNDGLGRLHEDLWILGHFRADAGDLRLTEPAESL
jgi:hypothetical protein